VTDIYILQNKDVATWLGFGLELFKLNTYLFKLPCLTKSVNIFKLSQTKFREEIKEVKVHWL